MQPLVPDYLVALAQQIGTLSAFLGGLSAALLVALLAMQLPKRVAGWTIALAAAAAVSFIVSVVATTLLVTALHPHAPAAVAGVGLLKGRVLTVLPFALGIFLLLGCIGLTGWLRSRRMGQITTIIAALGALLIANLMVNVG